MSVTPIKPATLPELVISDGDRVLAALNQAVADQKMDMELGQSARAVAIVWLREYPDGTCGDSWIVQGMTSIEAIGLLHMTATDIAEFGLTEGPNHFPPKEPA